MISPPLQGLRAWLTRPSAELARSEHNWARAGAQCLLAPTVRLRAMPLPDADRHRLNTLREGTWLVFVSPSSAQHFLEQWPPLEVQAKHWRVAAIGERTAQVVRERGLRVERIADPATAEVLGRLLAPEVANRDVVVPSSDQARPQLAEALRGAGGRVLSCVVQTTQSLRELPAQVDRALQAHALDLIVAYSPSALGFARAEDLRQRIASVPVAALGPTTAEAARRSGLQVVASPAAPSEPALIEAVAAWWGRREPPR